MRETRDKDDEKRDYGSDVARRLSNAAPAGPRAYKAGPGGAVSETVPAGSGVGHGRIWAAVPPIDYRPAAAREA